MTLKKSKKVYAIILDKSVKDKIDEIAKKQDRSSSNLVNCILKEYIKQYIRSDGESSDEKVDYLKLIKEKLDMLIKTEPDDPGEVLEVSKEIDKIISLFYTEK